MKALLLIVFVLVNFPFISIANSSKGHLDFCDKYLESFLDTAYNKSWDEFSDYLNDFNEDDKIKLLSNIEAFSFINYPHQVNELNSLFFEEKTLHDLNISEKYNVKAYSSIIDDIRRIFGKKKSKKWQQDAFSNFKDARKYLLTNRPEITLKTLKTIHRLMMKNGIEGIQENQLGRFRDTPVWGRVPASSPITRQQLKIIKENPYLDFKITSVTNDNMLTGNILYPSVSNVSLVILNSLKDKYPELVRQIKDIQTKSLDVPRELNRELISRLTEDLFNWYNKAREDLGVISSSIKIDRLISLVAEFQKKLVSIHPFINGNGRSSKELALQYPLMKEGLPPSRLVDFNSDMFLSNDKWAYEIKEGLINSKELIIDFINRSSLNLSINNSPELISPRSLRQIEVSFKKQGSKKIYQGYAKELIDSKQFLSFYLKYLENNPLFESRTINNPSIAYDEILDAFLNFQKNSHLYYDHKKHGVGLLKLNFADEDFIQWFGKNTYHSKKQYEAKMKLWYSDEIIWRGLSNQVHYVQEEEVVSMFKKIHNHLISNDLGKFFRNDLPEKKILENIAKEFRQYNQGLFDNSFVKMAKDHSEVGPNYRVSYGYSTSKKRTVGKAYAMGAMVIAPYGKHHNIELQNKLKSRILVGMKRANKDIDLTRLKQLRPEFSYKYGRQQEVMGVGAADPDSVEIIQSIDELGKVILNYYRNPDNPSQILVFTGEFHPKQDDLANFDILKVINL